MTHSSSISVNTAAVQSLSTKFDQNVASLSSSVAQRVSVPKDLNGRKAFLKNLAAKSAARLAAGGTALILVLLSSNEAQAQDATGVTLSSIEGVQSVEILADGSAVVTMENGAQMRLPADSFTQAGGEIIVSDAVAAQIGEAAVVAGGGSIGVIAGVAGGLAAVAGGGSSSSAGETALPTQAGSVVDGYIVNATVFQDVNGNGIFDQNEPNTTTDDKGEFNLTLDPSNPTAKLISFGGTDSSTGQDFTGTLTAPAGSDVITPLTTLVQSLVEKSAEDGEPISVEDANTQLAEALGLEGQNLLELDPVAAVETDGNADAFAAAAQVASVISAAAAAQDDGDADGEASGAAAATLAEQLLAANADGNANAEDVLNDAAVIQQALEDAGVDSAEANGVAAQIEAANDLIDNAADGGGNVQDIQSTIETVQEVVQGTVVDAIQDDNTALDEIDVVDQVDNLAPLRPVVHKSIGGTLGGEALAEGVFLSGAGRPESQVRVTIGDESKTVEVDTHGNWEVTFVTAELPSESGTFEAEVSAAQAGNSTFTVPVSGGSFEVDLTGPAAPTFDPVAENDILEVAEQGIALTVTGTAEANATIAVTIAGTTVREEVAGDGTFSVMFDPEDLPEADFSITAVATDSLGNEGQEATHSVAVEVPVHNVEGTSGDDLLTGTAGNDAIDPMGNDRGNDSIVGSTGNDTIDLSNSGDESFVTLDYGSLTGPIAAELNFADNTGTVDKGADGTDTLTSPETTAEADGFRLLGTSGDDTFTVTQDENYTSVQLHHAGGDDTVNATLNEGKLRFGILSNEDVTANLETGDVNFASGSVELNITGPVSGSGRFELLTSDGDDSVIGSDLGEQFILGGGTDTLDAAGGYDVVRYDRNGISGGVNVDLAAGTATGTWNGEAFSHSLSNVEEVRGTKGGNDTLTASDSGSHLRGNGGNDSLVGGAGNDLLDGGDGEDTFVVGLGDDTIRGYVDADDQVEFSPELTPEQIDTMVGSAQQDGNDVVLTLPNSATVRIENWTVAELQASHAGGSGGETNPVNGTSGDDLLTGTAGNDAIDPMGNARGHDSIVGSTGNDTIDLSNSGDESFISLDYGSLTGPIAAELNFADNTGTVDKGADGTDTLTSPETTAEADGFRLLGTSGDDTFTVTQDENYTSVQLHHAGGNDTVNATLNEGKLRFGILSNEDVTANLETGDVNFASGSVELNITGPVSGSGRFELLTGDGDDTVTGSDLGEQFILGGGTDRLDAGGGHDVVRYDHNGIDGGVAVNLAAGTATGSWNGEAFTHSLTNVEEVRGTREGDDTLTASDSGSHLRGNGGNDSLVGGAGNDLLDGGDGDDTFVVGLGDDTIRGYVDADDQVQFSPELTPEQVNAMVAEAQQDGDDVVVTLPNGATARIENWTVAELQASHAGGGSGGETNPINGTSGDDTLTGTGGNDAIDPMGNDAGDDLIIGSSGNDTIDLSNSGGESFVSLNYHALDAPISVELDYTKDLGTVDKGVNGTDTLTSPETTAEAEGLSLTGTLGDDTFNVVQGTDSTWTKVTFQGGDDTVTAVLNQGTLRLTTTDEDVTANLASGAISYAGGSIDLDVTGPVDGSGRIELETGDGDDAVTGSDLDERFILSGGTDTLDAGGGHDVVRYDRNGIDGGVAVNLATGTATGTWNGEAFTHSLTNVEEVRGTREGDDTLTASDSGSTLRGRGGDDSLVGGDGEDVFIVGEGHDTISNFDFEVDNLVTPEGGFDGTLPEFTEVEVGGEPAVRFDLGSDSSVTVTGISEKGFQNLVIGQALSLSPGAMTDPVTMTVTGNADYALIIRAVTETTVTNTPTELAFENIIPGEGLARFSIEGTGLSISGDPGSEVFTGTVSSATLTLDTSEVVSITDLNIPMTDFVAMVDSIQDNGNFNAGLGLGERDLILVANDVEQTIFVSGVDQWIEVNGSGADTVSFDGGGNAAIILGDGDDTVNISDSTPTEDRAFIYIDAESTGVKAINGFRFTNDPETGDRLVIEDTRGDFSIARLVDDIDDQDALNAIADELAGQGEYALFYENSGDAVLLEFASGNTLGDTVATFANADVSAFDGSNIDGYMKFLDIELPAASELV